jgi:hypothetical protein
MTCNNIWNPYDIQSSLLMSTRICILIHNRRSYRSSTSKLINRYCTTRHLLRSSTLSLCIINRSSICNHRGFCPMIPTIHWAHNKPKVIKGPICRYIRRCKPDILPSTLSRISWYTTTILRLPRCIHYVKYYLINRVNNLIRKSNDISIHHMRKNHIKPTNPIPYSHKKLG